MPDNLSVFYDHFAHMPYVIPQNEPRITLHNLPLTHRLPNTAPQSLPKEEAHPLSTCQDQ